MIPINTMFHTYMQNTKGMLLSIPFLMERC